MSFPVYLCRVEGDHWAAHMPDLLGCHHRAESKEALLDALPAVIQSHAEWLRAGGIPAPDPVEWHVAEVVDAHDPPGSPGRQRLFGSDRLELDPVWQELCLALAGRNRLELRQLVKGLPDRVLDWKPPDLPRPYSIRETLRHIAHAEQWYMDRLWPWESRDPDDVMELLAHTREQVVQRIRRLSPVERRAIYCPDRHVRGALHPGELWTARKVLRRILEHEREHIATIRVLIQTYPD